MISKHSSRREEQTAWEVGTVPFGPRNFPSTRLLLAVIVVLKRDDRKMAVGRIKSQVAKRFQSRVVGLRPKEERIVELGLPNAIHDEKTQRIDLA